MIAPRGGENDEEDDDGKRATEGQGKVGHHDENGATPFQRVFVGGLGS